MSRLRLTVLADELNLDFGGLFSQLCRVMPDAIDDNLHVSVELADELREMKGESYATARCA